MIGSYMTFTRSVRTFRPKVPLIVYIIPFAILCSCGGDEIGPSEINCDFNPALTDAWVYPVLPGTQEWLDLETTEARWKACQIPDEKLVKMSNKVLIDAWLRFPFIDNLFSSNSVVRSMEYMIQNFAGLREFTGRSNAMDTLIAVYRLRHPSCTVNLNSIDQGRYSLNLANIEYLIASDVMLAKLSMTGKKALVKDAFAVLEAKEKTGKTYYGDVVRGASLFVCIKAMQSAKYQPFDSAIRNDKTGALAKFLETGYLYTGADRENPIVQIIMNHSKKFIKD